MERVEIRGRCGTAIVYAKVIEEEAVEQIRRMCDYEFTEGESIRIMPDVHWGKGCTIGTTMTVRDKVVPNLVGVDIGCGMYTVDLGKGEIDLARFDAAAHFVPSGRNLWDGRQEKFDLLGLRCYRALKDTKRIARSLGTLGGGNHFIEICQKFARRNREVIARVLLELTGLTAGEAFHTIHNYIDVEERILRKGAIAVRVGERVLIPINMRDGSILAVGRGDPDWNYSAPHGAGRLMSRTAAKENLSMEEFCETMADVYTMAVNENTLDEAPMAYKSLTDIIDVVEDSVDVIEVLKPIYNFKAG